MPATRIQWALVLAAIAQCALYAALWQRLATTTPGVADASDLRGVNYRIETADGEMHVLSVESRDPSTVLVEASRRFENVVAIDRVSPDEAARVVRAKQRTHFWVLGLFVFPIGFLFTATRLGRLERERALVVEAFAPTLTMRIDALARHTGLPAQILQRRVAGLAHLGLDDVQWDPARGRVYDRRLSAYNVTLQFCPHCNEPITTRVRSDLTAIPHCPQCMTVFDETVLARMNEGLVGRLLDDSAARIRTPHFPVGTFLLWSLVFPPAAIRLALRAAG